MMEMTSYERFLRMFQHREADRIPIIDEPWEACKKRMYEEAAPRIDWAHDAAFSRPTIRCRIR